MSATSDIPFDHAPAAPDKGTALDEFVRLTHAKKDLEAQLRLIKDQLAPLEKTLLDEFSAEGVNGKRHAATGKLVSITRQIWARAAGGDKAAAAEALKRCPDTAAFVEPSFNVNSLSAYFREKARDAEAAGQPVLDPAELLPAELHGAIDLTDDFKLSVRS